MSERGTKHGLGQGKDRWDLVPYRAVRELVRVLTYGAGKYGAHNWTKGIPYSENFAAVMRHLTAWWTGDELDPETGLSHLAHAMCGIVFLLYYTQDPTYEVHDDRMRAEPKIRAVVPEVCPHPTHDGVDIHRIV